MHQKACPAHRYAFEQHEKGIRRGLKRSVAEAGLDDDLADFNMFTLEKENESGEEEEAVEDDDEMPPTLEERENSDDNKDEEIGYRRWQVNTAGITCVAFSSEGKHDGLAHESQISSAVYFAERRERATQEVEDVFIGECVPRFPVEDLVTKECDGHEVIYVVTGPQLFGKPAKRMRLLWAGLNKRTSNWMGPPSHMVQKHFGDLFNKRCVMHGEEMFVVSTRERTCTWVWQRSRNLS